MSNKKKKAPLRSEFTDALDEEIATRKILERANLKESEPPKVIVEQVEIQPPVKEIPAPVEEISVPPSIEVKPETKLEERILKEADNTFFDEKPARKPKAAPVDDKPPSKSTYRSKALRQWEEERDEKNPPPNPIAQAAEENEPRRTSRTERAGAIISIILCVRQPRQAAVFPVDVAAGALFPPDGRRAFRQIQSRRSERNAQFFNRAFLRRDTVHIFIGAIP